MSPEEDREIILLRVIGSAKLPQDDDLVRTKIEYFQERKEIFPNETVENIDDITLNQLQFGGLKSRVLGTFFTRRTINSGWEVISNRSQLRPA